VWTTDGKRVIFSFFKSGAPSFDLYSIAADGSGQPEPLLVRDFDQSPTSSSRDGRFVAFDESHAKTGGDIHVMSLGEDHATGPFLATSADEREASFSPDGRFVMIIPTGKNDEIELVLNWFEELKRLAPAN